MPFVESQNGFGQQPVEVLPRFSPKLSPLWRGFWFRFLTIKNVIHDGEQPPGYAVSADELHDQVMGECPGVTPGAYLHTDVAVRTNFTPVFKTGFLIQLQR